jgi:hypothetical protein
MFKRRLGIGIGQGSESDSSMPSPQALSAIVGHAPAGAALRIVSRAPVLDSCLCGPGFIQRQPGQMTSRTPSGNVSGGWSSINEKTGVSRSAW